MSSGSSAPRPDSKGEEGKKEEEATQTGLAQPETAHMHKEVPYAAPRIPKGAAEPVKRRLTLDRIVHPELPSRQQSQHLEHLGLSVEDGLIVRANSGKEQKASDHGSEPGSEPATTA